MKTEYFVFDDCCQRQEIKQVSQIFPDIGIAILTNALIVESIHLSDLSTFMISAQNSDAVFKSDF